MPYILKPTISQNYLERVRATPHAVGFKTKTAGRWRNISFQEFDHQCRKISGGLRGLGVVPGDRVAILSGTRLEWALADMAILGASAITVPIYPSNTPGDVAYILNHCEAKVAFIENAKQLEKLLSQRDSLKALQKIIVLDPHAMSLALGRTDVLTLESLEQEGIRENEKDPGAFESLLEKARPQDTLTLCYTSGTTGLPKGAMISQDAMVSAVEDCVKSFHTFTRPETETLLAFLPCSHILGKFELMSTWSFGWCEAYAESMEKIVDNLLEVKPTLLISVPRIFEKAFNGIQERVSREAPAKQKAFGWGIQAARDYFSAKEEGVRPSLLSITRYQLARKLILNSVFERFGGRLKFAICGGAPLPREIGLFFQAVGIQILEGYGLTETCGPVAVNLPNHPRFGTVGRPLPEVMIKTAADGEVLIKSRKVFSGYYKMPEESARALEDGWFKSGDIGVLDREGFLTITDRKKDLIITSAGKNIAPQKIENLAKSKKFIGQFVVHGDRRHYLTALITLDREQVIRYATENQILFSQYAELVKNPKIQGLVQKSVDELNQQLASFETIKKFIILPTEFTIESGELTPSLKVKRNVITQRYKADLDSMY